MKKFYSYLFFSFCFACGSFAQTVIDPLMGGNFDKGNTFADNGWIVVNSSANKWVVGSKTYYSAPNSAYISPDGDVNNYSYDNTTAHISHFYQKITLPPEAFNITIKFELKGIYEIDTNLVLHDGFEIFVDPSLTVPVADQLPGGGAELAFFPFGSSGEFTIQGTTLDYLGLAGKSSFIIFSWINDGNGIGDGPPASVDGISLTYCIKATPYNVTGGGSFCTGSSGVGLGLAGSTKGISYQLYYNGGTPVGDPIQGTGSALDFGPQNQVGTYSVIGKSACGDSYTMPGGASVSENPLPTATAGSNAPICLGTTLNLTSTGGTSYSWTGPNGFKSSAKDTSITNFTSDDAGTYMVTVTDANHCSAPATTEVTVTAGDTKGGKIPSVSICSGESGSLSLSGNSNNPDHWESTTDSTSVTWDKITNKTTSQSYSDITVPTFYRAVVSDGCGVAFSDTATVSIHNYWTGAASPDWNTKANWSDGKLPSVSSCPDVFIPGGTPNQPVLNNTPIATITNLHILANATLTIDNATMQIAGTIDNAGTFVASSGTLEFNGASPQTVKGITFDNKTVRNLIVSNDALSIAADNNDTLKISGVVYFGTASAKLTTGDNLTLLSTKDNTASIGTLGSDNSVTGKVEVERYINIASGLGSHSKSWQFLATPAKGQTLLQSWMEGGSATIKGYGAQFTGTAGHTGFDRQSAAPSVKFWDETIGNWTEIADANTQLYDPRGYFAFIRGDRTVSGLPGNNTPTPTILRSKGSIFTGNQGFTVPAQTAGNVFYSIGNPYPSAVDMTKVKTGANQPLLYIYIWKPSTGGEYGVGSWNTYRFNGSHYAPVPNDGTGTDFIQSGQAFLVQEDTNPTTVNFTESDKSTTSSIIDFRQQQVTQNGAQLITNLLSIDADGITALTDGTLQQFDKSYSFKVNTYDARKIMNTTNNLSIKTSGLNLVVERRPRLTEQDTIFYNLASMAKQNYRLEFKAQGLSSEDLEGFIEDTYLNTRSPLSMEGTTNVDFAVTSYKASYATNRFRIVFKTAVVLPVKLVSVTAEQKEANIEVKWQVENEHTVKQYGVEKSIDGVSFKAADTTAAANNDNGAASYLWLDGQATPGYNYYRIRMEDQNGQVTYSSVVKVLVPFGKPSIGIYPNPIIDGIIHLQFVNQPQGRYGIRLLNPLGQTIVAKQIEHAGGNATENLKWDYNLAHGVYQLQLLKPDGKIQVIKVMY